MAFEEISKAIGKTNSKRSARIYRVPEELRKLNESAYTPHLVSIGPLHSVVKYLKPHMEDIKLSYVGSLLGKTKGEGGDAKAMLQECLEDMTKSKDDAKQYYAEEVELDENMLVTDGCFVLEVLRRISPITKYSSQSSNPLAVPKKDHSSCDSDPLSIPLTLETVKQDLLLLENQLPFSVLQTLFKRTLAKISKGHTLSDYVVSSFGNRLKIGDHVWSNTSATKCCCPLDHCPLSLGQEKVDFHHHILDRLYNYYLGEKGDQDHTLDLPYDPYLGDPPPQSQVEGDGKSPGTHSAASAKGRPRPSEPNDMPSASDLAYKGVKFEPCKNLSEVKFETLGPFCRARFRIPTLYVDDSTEAILRNLIALEQCCPGFQLRFTSYAYLMDRLVNTAKDVEELGGEGLIHNSLATGKEASRFFNNLCKRVTLDSDLYSAPCKLAVGYSQRCLYRFIPATMTHFKCKIRASPWTSIAFFVAFVSFGISLTNFIRSFLG